MKNLPIFLALLLLSSLEASAFPPAPHHTIFGSVRDKYGDPLSVDNARVILTSTSGKVIHVGVVPNLGPGLNYRLEVPMDAGLTSDAYRPDALRPMVPFTIRVQIGASSFVPMELDGDFSQLGRVGKFTRLDLTLGEDSDGDGIPDAWERDLLKPGQSLADIKPGDDSDGDGISNLDEYVAGSYAFDDSNGFSLEIDRFEAGKPVVKFMGISGRSYTVYGSANLESWRQLNIQLPVAEGEDAGASFGTLLATEIEEVELIVEQPADGPAMRFFRLMVR